MSVRKILYENNDNSATDNLEVRDLRGIRAAQLQFTIPKGKVHPNTIRSSDSNQQYHKQLCWQSHAIVLQQIQERVDSP